MTWVSGNGRTYGINMWRTRRNEAAVLAMHPEEGMKMSEMKWHFLGLDVGCAQLGPIWTWHDCLAKNCK